MPAVVAPEAEARILLMSTDEVVVAVPDNSVLTAETELIGCTCFRLSLSGAPAS
jgi:hypothetical protein